MKALTLTQPWASLVMYSAKLFETRSWSTAYRGPLFIHSALKFPKDAKELCGEEPFCSGLINNRPEALPLGKLLSLVELVEVYETKHAVAHGIVQGVELLLGNYEPGRYAWKLRWIAILSEPIHCKGALGLWNLPPEIEAMVRGQNHNLKAYLAAS